MWGGFWPSGGVEVLEEGLEFWFLQRVALSFFFLSFFSFFFFVFCAPFFLFCFEFFCLFFLGFFFFWVLGFGFGFCVLVVVNVWRFCVPLHLEVQRNPVVVVVVWGKGSESIAATNPFFLFFFSFLLYDLECGEGVLGDACHASPGYSEDGLCLGAGYPARQPQLLPVTTREVTLPHPLLRPLVTLCCPVPLRSPLHPLVTLSHEVPTSAPFSPCLPHN